MPDVQEVFRLATNKVKPDPNALERQQKRQRASTRSTRARAYLVVAAVIAAIAIGVTGGHEDGRPRRHDTRRVDPAHDPHVRHGASLRRGRAERRRSSIFRAIRPGR